MSTTLIEKKNVICATTTNGQVSESCKGILSLGVHNNLHYLEFRTELRGIKKGAQIAKSIAPAAAEFSKALPYYAQSYAANAGLAIIGKVFNMKVNHISRHVSQTTGREVKPYVEAAKRRFKQAKAENFGLDMYTHYLFNSQIDNVRLSFREMITTGSSSPSACLVVNKIDSPDTQYVCFLAEGSLANKTIEQWIEKLPVRANWDKEIRIPNVKFCDLPTNLIPAGGTLICRTHPRTPDGMMELIFCERPAEKGSSLSDWPVRYSVNLQNQRIHFNKKDKSSTTLTVHADPVNELPCAVFDFDTSVYGQRLLLEALQATLTAPSAIRKLQPAPLERTILIREENAYYTRMDAFRTELEQSVGNLELFTDSDGETYLEYKVISSDIAEEDTDTEQSPDIRFHYAIKDLCILYQDADTDVDGPGFTLLVISRQDMDALFTESDDEQAQMHYFTIKDAPGNEDIINATRKAWENNLSATKQ